MNYCYLCLVLVLVLGIIACGCTSQQKPLPPTPVPTVPPAPVITTPTPQPFPVQLAGNWVLQTMGIQGGSVPLTPTTQITLSFNADGTAQGYSGCNNYYTTYTLTGISTPKGDGMILGPITTSKKYCVSFSDQENTYLSTLKNTGAYVVNGELLTLTTPTQNALIYKRAADIVPTTVYYPHPA